MPRTSGPKFETLPPLVLKHGAKAGENASVMTMNIYKYNLNQLAKEGIDTKEKIMENPKKTIQTVNALTESIESEATRRDKRRMYYSAIFWAITSFPDSLKIPFRDAFRSNMRDYKADKNEPVKDYVPEPKMNFPSKDPVYFLSTRSKKTHVWELKTIGKAGYRTAVPIAKIDLSEKKPKCEPITSDKVLRLRFPGKHLYSGLELQLSHCTISLEDFYPVTVEYARNTKILLLDGKELTNICNTTI